MKPKGSIRIHSGQSSHRATLPGISRELPLVEVKPGIFIASDADLILGDVEFLSKSSELLATKVRPLKVDVVVTAEAKSIALAYELSKRLSLERFVVARKSQKAYMGDYFSQKVRSITTESEQQLLITREELDYLCGKRVCLLDDVVSTGATFTALGAIVKRAGGKIVCKAAIWREGPWCKQQGLIHLGTLPIFQDRPKNGESTEKTSASSKV